MSSSNIICQYHLRGDCRYGVKCWNTHLDSSIYDGIMYRDDLHYQAVAHTSRKCLERQIAKAAQGDQRCADNMNAFIALLADQNDRKRSAQSTSTSSTNTSMAQIRVQDLCARPSQSTSATSTNASIAQIRVQDLCARPPQSTSTSTKSTNALTTQLQAQELQLQLEASKRPILKQPDNSKIAMEMVANELSVAMKTGNGNSEKETASNFHDLYQKKMKESTEKHDSVWEDILLSTIDSDLLCNICFEIFIKPTVLNCSHTFCETCIYVWTDRVVACPICRVEVTSKSYCLTLESFIEKIVEHLPKEIKDKREVAIKDRIERPQRVTDRLNMRSINTFNGRFRFNELDIFGMNIQETDENTGGAISLMRYIIGMEEETSNSPFNSSTRH